MKNKKVFGLAVLALILVIVGATNYILSALSARVDLTAEQLYDNAAEMLNAISKLKPQALKGTYMKSAALCSTMSHGVKVDLKAFLTGAEK